MNLYLISSEIFFPAELSLLEEMFEKGEFVFHLRKPEASREETKKILQKLSPAYLSRTVIHQHHDLAKEFAIKGIHLKSKIDLSLTSGEIALLKNHKSQLTISCSLHDLSEIEMVDQAIDYAFISPVFDSISKKGYVSKIDLEQASLELEILRSKKNTLKVVALGGVQPAHLRMLKESGFHGAGVLGAVWEAEHPVERLVEFLNLLPQL